MSEYLGQEIFDEFIKPNFDRCLTGEIINYQEWFEYPKLGRRFVDVTYFPYCDKENSIRGIIANTRDITDYKKNEEIHRQVQKMLARTERIAHIGSWEWEIETDTVTWSEELYRIFQIDPNEKAPSWAEHPKLYHPEDFENLRQAAEITVKNGTPYEIGLRAIRKDGETRVCLASGFAELGENEKPVRLFGSLHDITEQKKIEASLAKSESLFRGLYDNMPSGSAIYKVINDGSKGSDYIIMNFNHKSLEIEDKTLEQVVGKSLFDLRPNIDDYGLIPVMKKVWETGEPAYFPVKIYQDAAFSNYYENYIFKIPTGEVVTIYNDVTNKKNSEMALKRSEERFALAMEFASDGIFDWNLETNEIYYSPGWKRMLGYEDDELPNDFSIWETLTEPEDVKRSWKMQNELINKKRDKFEIELKMRHKDGHWVSKFRLSFCINGIPPLLF